MTATLNVPDRSLEQRREALRRANVIRIQRAELKRELKAGRRTVVPLLLDPPEFTATMKAMDLVLAVPKVGQAKAGLAFRRAGISPSKTVSGMSDRQRAALVAQMTRRAA